MYRQNTIWGYLNLWENHTDEFLSFNTVLHLSLDTGESEMQICCIIIEKLFLTAPSSHPEEHFHAHIIGP